MDIERVNDYTIKFFISYLDIENRGFDREEIWYNRERGEELFWEMMDEANHEESFSLEGPLWIQVQAMENGLEIIVTRAQMSQDGSKLELPISQDKHLDIPLNESEDDEEALEEEIDKTKTSSIKSKKETADDKPLSFLIKFADIEDVITLSREFSETEELATGLYHYNDAYYLYVTLYPAMSEQSQDNTLSHLLEFGEETPLTHSIVAEYGKLIIAENALTQIDASF